ncbi:MAG: hypothetical protein U0835_21000 [Isosphaeraceae bacterium]
MRCINRTLLAASAVVALGFSFAGEPSAVAQTPRAAGVRALSANPSGEVVAQERFISRLLYNESLAIQRNDARLSLRQYYINRINQLKAMHPVNAAQARQIAQAIRYNQQKQAELQVVMNSSGAYLNRVIPNYNVQINQSRLRLLNLAPTNPAVLSFLTTSGLSQTTNSTSITRIMNQLPASH